MLYRRKSESCDKFKKKMCIFNQNYLPGGGFFINENNFLVLKRDKYDGIRTCASLSGRDRSPVRWPPSPTQVLFPESGWQAAVSTHIYPFAFLKRVTDVHFTYSQFWSKNGELIKGWFPPNPIPLLPFRS